MEFLISGLRSGIRGRSLQVVFAMGVLTVVVAFLAGDFSPRQPQTVALDIGFSGLRFSLVLLNLFWVQELVVREIDRKTIFFSLTYPVPRSAFVLGRFLAILVLGLLAAVVLGLLLTVAVISVGTYAQQLPPSLGLPFWSNIAGIVVDSVVVMSFALCLASIATAMMLPMALGAILAIAGKALGPAMDYVLSGADGDVQFTERFGPLLGVIRWVLPDLARLDWRDWPLYQSAPDAMGITWALLMAAAYISLMLVITVSVFERREFC